MRAEVQLFEKSGTINCLFIISYIPSFQNLYSQFNLMIWSLIFQKAELQHSFFARVMGPIRMNSRSYGYFFTLIPMHLKFLENSPYLRNFVHLQDWWQFCRFHSTGYVKWAENLCLGVTYYAESHGQKSFSKFENFTLSRSKVWNLPFELVRRVRDVFSTKNILKSFEKPWAHVQRKDG